MNAIKVRIETVRNRENRNQRNKLVAGDLNEPKKIEVSSE